VEASVDRRAGEISADVLLFAAAILASAFLLFIVQPMVAKSILPWFGGTPGVWSACLAFYQTMLFVGYAYAHALIRYASARAQLVIHLALVVGALLALPVLPAGEWQPDGTRDPLRDILGMLGANVALPFLVLSATGPLVQSWFARRHPGRSPYPLYALSNAGSLLALIAYPFFIEPRWTLGTSSRGWSIAFGVCSVAVLACAMLATRSAAAAASMRDRTGAIDPPRSDPPRALVHAGWMLLPGCAVVLLMGVTNKVCLDVASVPFLWILPLAAYLLTFILSFSSERTYRRGAWVAVSALALLATSGQRLWSPLLGDPAGGSLSSVSFQIPAWCGLLFATCMILHGELYRLRPSPDRLTSFYLYVSAGGAAGGLFVGLAAPVWFDDYYELPLGLAGTIVLLQAARALDPRSGFRLRGAGGGRSAIELAVTAGVVLAVVVGTLHRFEGLIHRERSFFGVLRVVERGQGDDVQRQLASGSTVHGVQYTAAGYTAVPTTYYGRGTAMGLWLGGRPVGDTAHIGIIGLGVGTLAAYGQAGDRLRYYEIDPSVVGMARDDGYFSYLAESRAEVEVVEGDARLSLADEQSARKHGGFDALVLDAFNSDAIPVHLLTREAFELYAAALGPEGLLFVHASNRHFDLMPLIARQGFEVGLESLYVESAHAPAVQSHRALWVVLSREPERLHALSSKLRRRASALGLARDHLLFTRPLRDELASLRVWTDDYSDLFGALRRNQEPDPR
jgi:spermidine synthase